MTATNNNEDEEVLTPEDGTHDDEIDNEEDDHQDDEETLDDDGEGQEDIEDDDGENSDDDDNEDEDDEPAPPTVDYREKFSASTRENQKLTSQIAELQKQIGDLTKEEIPTDDEMIAELGADEWDSLSDRERNTERKLMIFQKRDNARTLREKAQNKDAELKTAVDNFMDLEENNDISGMNNEFLEFVKLPKNAGASFETLKDAFLYRVKKPAKQTKSKSPTLMRGTGSGAAPVRKAGEMTDEELKKLRTTDPKRYNDMIRKGQIK